MYTTDMTRTVPDQTARISLSISVICRDPPSRRVYKEAVPEDRCGQPPIRDIRIMFVSFYYREFTYHMDLFLFFLEQIAEPLKGRYPQVFIAAIIAAILLFCVMKFRQRRWSQAISTKYLKTAHLHNMWQRTNAMRRVSAILPVITYIIASYSVSFLEESSSQDFIQAYTVFIAPGLLCPAVQQYRQTPKEAHLIRRAVLLIPGLLCIIFAFAVWESFFRGNLKLLAASLVLYIVGPVIAEWGIYLSTEEKEGKLIKIKIRDHDEIVLPYSDFKETQNYICIRERDQKSGEIVSTRKIPMGEVVEIKTEGISKKKGKS